VALFALRPAAAIEYGAIASLGSIGNRVYTGLDEDEMYVVLRGKDLARIAEALHVISGANRRTAGLCARTVGIIVDALRV
jgi:uncharacterized protein (DUF169 family)